MQHRVLVVDDDPLLCKQICLYLKSCGYEVQGRNSGAEALALLQEGEWDLVLLDIVMPEMDGVQVLTEIRKTHSLLTLPVIMVTSQSSCDQVVDALHAGANDYLVKPLDYDIALARVSTQLTCKDLVNAKDEFLSIASHDLKKPLMLIQDIADQLRLDLAPGGTVSQQHLDDLGALLRTADGMEQVIEGFLNAESIRAGELQVHKSETDIGQLLTEVVSNNQSYAKGKHITLTNPAKPTVARLSIDRKIIKAVVDNLVGNAIKFSPAHTQVLVDFQQRSDAVQIEVRDSGPGLKEAEFGKLFGKHVKLSNKPTGHETSSGLGLYLSHCLIEQHGGSIGAANNPDGGMTFWINLPIEAMALSVAL